MERYSAAIQRFVVIVLVVLLLLIFAMSFGSSRSSQRVGDAGVERGSTPSTAGNRARSDGSTTPRVRKSAGACVYGAPEKIVVYAGEATHTLRPGDRYFEELRRSGERVVLRVAEFGGESKVPGGEVVAMGDNAKYTVTFTYGEAPTFACFSNSLEVTGKVAPGATDLSTVTFFIPKRVEEMEPGTIYDGFYYGDIKMISTLTNAELAETLETIYEAAR